jgi:hypothetical protein
LIEPQAFQVGEGVRRRGLLFANFAYSRGAIHVIVDWHIEVSFSIRPPYKAALVMKKPRDRGAWSTASLALSLREEWVGLTALVAVNA